MGEFHHIGTGQGDGLRVLLGYVLCVAVCCCVLLLCGNYTSWDLYATGSDGMALVLKVMSGDPRVPI